VVKDTDTAKLEQLYSLLQAPIARDLMGPGVLTDADMAKAAEVLPEPKSAFDLRSFDPQAVRAQYADTYDRAMENLLTNRGFKVRDPKTGKALPASPTFSFRSISARTPQKTQASRLSRAFAVQPKGTSIVQPWTWGESNKARQQRASNIAKLLFPMREQTYSAQEADTVIKTLEELVQLAPAKQKKVYEAALKTAQRYRDRGVSTTSTGELEKRLTSQESAMEKVGL
jgi:hypothetical protein